MSPDEFDWFFDRNPAGPRLLSEVREDGRSLGVLAMSYARAQVEGEEQLVAFAVARGHAPGGARARDLRRRSSWTTRRAPRPRGRRWRSGSRTRWRGRSSSGSSAGTTSTGCASGRGRCGCVARAPARSRRGAASYLESFDARHEELWRRRATATRSCAAPSTSPGATSTRRATTGCSATSAASRSVGHAVRKGFSAGVVCELVGPAHRLLRRCVRESKGCDIVLGVPGPGQRARLPRGRLRARAGHDPRDREAARATA